MNVTATSYIYELSAEVKVNILHDVIATGEIKSHEDLELCIKWEVVWLRRVDRY